MLFVLYLAESQEEAAIEMFHAAPHVSYRCVTVLKEKERDHSSGIINSTAHGSVLKLKLKKKF